MRQNFQNEKLKIEKFTKSLENEITLLRKFKAHD